MNGRIGRFQVLAEIGRGGFGQVLRAFDPQRGREVAIKLLLKDDPRAQARFAREVAAATRLRHPNVVPVLESGDLQGRPYLVMDLVQGETLAELAQRERALSTTRAAELLRDVARGVAYAHSEGVLHRDLKPDNVLVDKSGTPRILDFGLALLADSAERLTLSGAAMGTPSYLAPEQAVGGQADQRTDVYGLGATLYFALTREGPFDRHANPLLAVHRVEPDPPSAIVPGIPRLLDAVCRKALAKDPAARYASAEELIAALDQFLLGSDSAVLERGPGGALRKLLPALGGLALLVGALGVGVLLGRPPASRETQGAAPSPTQATGAATPTGDVEAALAACEEAFAADAAPAVLVERAAAAERAAGIEPGAAPGDAAYAQRLLRARLRAELSAAAGKAWEDAREGAAAPLLAALGALAERAGEDVPLRDRLTLSLAEACLARGHFEEAQAALDRVRGEEGGRPVYLRAAVRYAQGRYSQAKELLEGMRRSHPSGLWSELAQLRLAADETEPRALLVRRRRELPAGARPPRALAVALLRCEIEAARDLRERQALARELAGSPLRDESSLWLILAIQEVVTDRPDEAAVNEWLARVRELCAPRVPGRHDLALGHLLMTTGKNEEAVPPLQRAARALPEDAVAMLVLGLALNGLGRWEQSAAAFLEGARRDFAQTRLIVTTISPLPLRLRVERLLELPCRAAAPPVMRAQMEQGMGKAPGSIKDSVSALVLATAAGEPMRALQPLLARVKQALGPNQADYLFLAAQTYAARGKRKEAVAALNEARRLQPPRSAHDLLSDTDTLISVGELAGYREAMTRVLELGGSPTEVATAQAALAWLADENQRALEILEQAFPGEDRTPRIVALSALAHRDLGHFEVAFAGMDTVFQRMGYTQLGVARARATLLCRLAFAGGKPAKIEAALTELELVFRLGDAEAGSELCRCALTLPQDTSWYALVPSYIHDLERLGRGLETPLLRAFLVLREEGTRAEVDRLVSEYRGQPNQGFARLYRERFGADPVWPRPQQQ
ncbi:MAG: protein kinase [Planctomycetota bacterium]